MIQLLEKNVIESGLKTPKEQNESQVVKKNHWFASDSIFFYNSHQWTLQINGMNWKKDIHD